MALTLLQAAMGGKMTALQQAVVKVYAESHEILRVLPFETIGGNAISYELEADLPRADFRGYNEGYTEGTGTTTRKVDALAIAGGDCDVDNALVKQGGMERRTQEVQRKVKSLAHLIGHTFIKGDSATDRKSFDGLQNRCLGNQLLAAGSTSGGDALSMAKLDELIDLVDNPTHLLVSKAVRRLLTAAARTTSVGGYITQGKDEFGRLVEMYRDLPLVVMDPNGGVYSTLAFNEANPGGGSAVGTSIYCVSFVPGGCVGIQNGPPEVTDFKQIPSSPVWRTRVEWNVGLKDEHPRSIARLYGVKNAAVTA